MSATVKLILIYKISLLCYLDIKAYSFMSGMQSSQVRAFCCSKPQVSFVFQDHVTRLRTHALRTDHLHLDGSEARGRSPSTAPPA